jgi:hypothetical protein
VAAEVAARLGRFPFLAEAPLGQIQGDYRTIFGTICPKELQEAPKAKLATYQGAVNFLPPAFAQMLGQLL